MRGEVGAGDRRRQEKGDGGCAAGGGDGVGGDGVGWKGAAVDGLGHERSGC